MKSRQFCSVCKQWLDMEVVPTGDGDDDGVVWFRCPQCQGFLPKLNQRGAAGDDDSAGAQVDGGSATGGTGAGRREASGTCLADERPGRRLSDSDAARDADRDDDDLRADDPGNGRGSARDAGRDDEDDDGSDDDGSDDDRSDDDLVGDPDDDPAVGSDPASPPLPAGATPAEPVLEYAAMLAAVDPGAAVPYRPWATYEVGQCVLHLAWNDCGVVVGKEALPGGRHVIKCWFQGAGVVRLIENAPR